MAKYTGPKCKLCRREGRKLFLKGARCNSEKCAINKRNQPPGQHGGGRGRRQSDYNRLLREKQKVKRMYGILEVQFRRYYDNAAKVKGITGQLLLQTLERRLDNVVYQSGFGTSRAQSRQLVNQGKVKVNGNIIDIPSYEVSAEDKVEFTGKEVLSKEKDSIPEWLSVNEKDKVIKINRLPEREDISAEINEQLIIEFYSR